MTTEVTLDADIEGFEVGADGIYAVVLLYEKNDEEYDELWRQQEAEYPRRLVPEQGRYQAAKFEVTVSASADPRGVEETVGRVESVAEFEAEVIHVDVDAPVFELYDVDDGRRVGEMRLEPDHLPDWFDDVGDRAFVTVRMEYDHERSVELLGDGWDDSEGDIERRRENMQELFEQLEEEYP